MPEPCCSLDEIARNAERRRFARRPPDPEGHGQDQIVQLIGKDLIRKAIGRSPDHLDAGVMALVQSVGLARLGYGALTHLVYQ